MAEDLSTQIAVREGVPALTAELAARFKERFPSPFEVTVDDPTLHQGTWSQEVFVRKGSTVGAQVELKWEANVPTVTAIVTQNSKRDTQITMGVLLPLGILGAYLAYNDVGPLEFLPGKKIAATLGILIGLISGLPIVFGLRSLVGRNDKPENEKLLATVHGLVQEVAATKSAAAQAV